MSTYSEIIEEIDSSISELKKLKHTMIQDALNISREDTRWYEYNPIFGSKAMFKRSKLNIRDCFRRIEWKLDLRQGESYHSIVAKGGKTLRSGELE
jgi:hypothetical protein